MAITAQDALRLTVAHNLGSANNTLVPGVEIPAFTVGMDPNTWATRVKAIGLSRLQPAGMSSSQFTYADVPMNTTIGSGPNGRGILAPKSEQEKAQAIQLLVDSMTPAASADGGEPSPFSSGKWIFGNDFGGLQSAFTANAQLREQAQQAARRDAILAQQAQFNQQQAQQSARLQAEAVAAARTQAEWNNRFNEANAAANRGQTDWANQIALQDRALRGDQLSFENALRLRESGGTAADAAIAREFANNSINNLGVVRGAVADAEAQVIEANRTLAKNWNARPENAGANVGVDAKGSFVARRDVDPGLLLDLQNQAASSPAMQNLMRLQKGYQLAELDAQRLPPTAPRTGVLPTLPNMASYGLSPQYRKPMAPLSASGVRTLSPSQSGPDYMQAIPYITQDALRGYRQVTNFPQYGTRIPATSLSAPTPASVPMDLAPNTLPAIQPPGSVADFSQGVYDPLQAAPAVLEKVWVIAPDGRRGRIPKSQLADAIEQGYTYVPN